MVETNIVFLDETQEYEITKGHRVVKIHIDKLRKLKELYCGSESLTIPETCRRLDINRADFMFIKYAFNITHTDVPFIDEDIMNGNLDELADITLEQKKKTLFDKMYRRDINRMKSELEKYRYTEYLFDKAIDRLSEIQHPDHEVVVRIVNVDSVQKRYESMLVNFADIHTGSFSASYWNVFNKDVLRKRFDTAKKEIVERIHMYGIKSLYMMELGDAIHGIIHDTNRVEADLNVIEQVKYISELYEDLLYSLAPHVENLFFASTFGNHGRVVPTKTGALDTENFEMLIFWYLHRIFENHDTIKIMPNEYDEQFIVFDIMGNFAFGTHGDRDKPTKAPSNIALMFGVKPSQVYLGHTHRLAWDEIHMVEVFVSRSFSGVDNYSKSSRFTSKAGFNMYLYDETGVREIIPVVFRR